MKPVFALGFTPLRLAFTSHLVSVPLERVARGHFGGVEQGEIAINKNIWRTIRHTGTGINGNGNYNSIRLGIYLEGSLGVG